MFGGNDFRLWSDRNSRDGVRMPEIAVRRQRRPLAVRLSAHEVRRVRQGTQQAERVPLHGIERGRCELVRACRRAARAARIVSIIAGTLAADTAAAATETVARLDVFIGMCIF